MFCSLASAIKLPPQTKKTQTPITAHPNVADNAKSRRIFFLLLGNASDITAPLIDINHNSAAVVVREIANKYCRCAHILYYSFLLIINEGIRGVAMMTEVLFHNFSVLEWLWFMRGDLWCGARSFSSSWDTNLKFMFDKLIKVMKVSITNTVLGNNRI